MISIFYTCKLITLSIICVIIDVIFLKYIKKMLGTQKELKLITIGKQAINDEIAGLKDLYNSIDYNFCKIIDMIINHRGRLIFSGMGKSGHIAKKVSSTFLSIGIPSFFIHPSEASHGDLGMITKQDLIILVSNSGNTDELKTIINYCKKVNVFIIGITRANNSILTQRSDLSVVLPNTREASDINIPSTSVIMMMAFWDAISITIQKIKNFSKSDFQKLHPGGKIGVEPLTVSELMHKNPNVPLISTKSSIMQVIIEITKKRFGCSGVINNQGELIGIVTDSHISKCITLDLKTMIVDDIMTVHPITIQRHISIAHALVIMTTKNVSQIFIVKNKRPIGIIHIQDLLQVNTLV